MVTSESVVLSLVKNVLSLFGLGGLEGRELSDGVAPKHQDNDEEESKHCKEGHHAVHPADADSVDPGVDVEVDGQAEEEAHRVEHEGGLDRVRAEALADVVDRDRDADEGADGDKELPEGHDDPVHPVLQSDAHQPQSQRHEHKVSGPHGVESVLGLPDALVPRDQPHRYPVAEELAVHKPDHKADPVDEGDCGKHKKVSMTTGAALLLTRVCRVTYKPRSASR